MIASRHSLSFWVASVSRLQALGDYIFASTNNCCSRAWRDGLECLEGVKLKGLQAVNYELRKSDLKAFTLSPVRRDLSAEGA